MHASCLRPAMPRRSVTSNERLDRNVAFIQKPFTAAALTRKVRQVLDG